LRQVVFEVVSFSFGIERAPAVGKVKPKFMRIGILKADETPKEMVDVHGPYEDFYVQLLSPYGFDFTIYPVFDGKFPSSVDEAGGWLITGSRHSVLEDKLWILRLKEFILEVRSSRTPMVGICFGHQVIASALGGKVERSKAGWTVGPVAYKRTSTGKIQNVLVWHQDEVTTCAQDTKILASSSTCQNVILQYGKSSRPFSAIQSLIRPS
jgi:GMP synthase-like glutamine amidotransferase